VIASICLIHGLPIFKSRRLIERWERFICLAVIQYPWGTPERIESLASLPSEPECETVSLWSAQGVLPIWFTQPVGFEQRVIDYFEDARQCPVCHLKNLTGWSRMVLDCPEVAFEETIRHGLILPEARLWTAPPVLRLVPLGFSFCQR